VISFQIRPGGEVGMLNEYGPILIFGVLGCAFPFAALWAAKFFRPTRPGQPKNPSP